jgi:protein required for attachment to host cells
MKKRPQLAHDIWVAVCDGEKALLLQNDGDQVYPKLETREVLGQENPKTRDIGTDAPGRNFNSSDGRASAMEPTDFHRLAEEAFLKNFADHIEHEVLAGKIKELILVAPPRALGVMRPKLAHKEQYLRAEVEKDYAGLPVYEIEKHLTKLFQAAS